MNLRLMHDGQHLRIGEYTISPIKPRDGIEKVWVQNSSGEGMETSTEDLEEHLQASLEGYFDENM